MLLTARGGGGGTPVLAVIIIGAVISFAIVVWAVCIDMSEAGL
jgi:hypothetical protein